MGTRREGTRSRSFGRDGEPICVSDLLIVVRVIEGGLKYSMSWRTQSDFKVGRRRPPPVRDSKKWTPTRGMSEGARILAGNENDSSRVVANNNQFLMRRRASHLLRFFVFFFPPLFPAPPPFRQHRDRRFSL